MTITAEHRLDAPGPGPDAPGPADPGRARWHPGRLLDPVTTTRRTWLLHLVLLSLVVGAVLAIVGNGQVMDADEGAALAQAQILNHTGQWGLPATSQLDPTGTWFPIDLSNPVGGRMYPFTRPPIYPAVIAPLLRAGGLDLVIALQAVGLVVAALATGLLAERLRPRRGIQAMWLTAVLSPLLFDGYWVIAHTLAAAGATLAVYGAVKVVLDRRHRWLPGWFAGLAVAVLFRSEALIFCVGLAIGLGLLAVTGRPERRRASALLSVGTLGVGAAAYWSMTLWRRSVELGSATAGYRPALAGGLVSGRIQGFEHTILDPGAAGGVGALLVVVAAGTLIAAVAAARFELLSPATRRGLALCAAAAAVVRLFLPVDLVTGLLMAGPLVVGAACCLPRARLADRATRFAAIVAGVTTLGIMATQQQYGGGGEWGGRYFHVVLPLGCALAIVTLDWLIEHRGAVGRTIVAAGLVVSLALSILAVREAVAARDVAKTLTDAAWSAAVDTQSAHQPGGPVVVSTWVAGGRFSWQHLLDGRYLTVDDPHDFPELGRRLRHEDVPDLVVLAEPSDAGKVPEIGSGYAITRRIPLGTHGWTVDVLSRS